MAMTCVTLTPSHNSQQPETAERLVFRSTRDQEMKGSLTLAACLDSLATEHLASELSRLRGHSVTLDAAQVTFLGALALQLLIAAQRQWKIDGKAFSIIDPAAAFLEGIAVLGSAPGELGITERSEVTQ